MALQPIKVVYGNDLDLQQQKLLWHYSLISSSHFAVRSTIVEIIMALQPRLWYRNMRAIYNSRNYYGIIAASRLRKLTTNLQQQKLLWHYSPQSHLFLVVPSTIVEIIMALQPCVRPVNRPDRIYNSRNYYGIIAFCNIVVVVTQSTIVEIIMALQPVLATNHRIKIYNSRNYYGIIAFYPNYL